MSHLTDQTGFDLLVETKRETFPPISLYVFNFQSFCNKETHYLAYLVGGGRSRWDFAFLNDSQDPKIEYESNAQILCRFEEKYT